MSKKESSGLGKFAVGALVGAGLGVLFAPDKGEVTRKKLQKKINELLNEVKEIDVEDVKLQLEEKIDEIKYELEDLDKEKALKIAKTKAKALQTKCEELVDYAVEKGTPVLEEAAEEVKEQTVKVMKEILKKLEKETNKSK